MGLTLEEYEKRHVDETGALIEDKEWFYMQSMLGTQKDAEKAWDKDGKFHCINWWNCMYCPAFHSEHCL